MRKSNLTKGIIPWLLVFLLICGCASNMARQKVKNEISDIEKTTITPPSMPPELSFSPLLAAENEKEEFFSFSGKDLALEDVLYPLSKKAGFNIIWDKEVDPKTPVSVSFEDLTLKEALDAIFAPTDYLYSTNSPTLCVKLVDTRVFELGQIPFQITTTMSVGGDVLGSIPNAGGLSGQFKMAGTTDKEATDFWKQIEEGMKSIISPDGKYFVNKLGGLVTVTDRKKNLLLAQQFIEKLKSSLSRQVLIEAEVVEVTLEQGQSWGINWSTVQSFLLNHKNVTLTGNQTLGLEGSVVQFTASRQDASVVLDVLGRFGQVDVLSKPRVNVMNGQTALINVGRVVSYWELTGLSAGAQVGQPIIYPEQKTVLLGLTMGVTPYISSDGYVTLQVLPIVSDASTWSEFQFDNQTLKAPNIDIREANTTVRIKDGETIVIGGLITSKKTDTEHKIPVLGDMPLLGYLFKSKEKTEQRAELVIFLTPRITTFDKKEG
jgi:MSHA biogenesis protein MshL